MAAPHPKADVRIILSYIIGPCSKLADGTYSTLRPAAPRHLPGVRPRPSAAPPRRRLATGNAALLHPRPRSDGIGRTRGPLLRHGSTPSISADRTHQADRQGRVSGKRADVRLGPGGR